MVDGTTVGVGTVMINESGTLDGRLLTGTMMFDDGKMKTQADLGAYDSGMTTPLVGRTDGDGKYDNGMVVDVHDGDDHDGDDHETVDGATDGIVTKTVLGKTEITEVGTLSGTDDHETITIDG
jgi:hypothetical protein